MQKRDTRNAPRYGPRYWKLIAYTIARHEGGRRRPAEPVPKEKPSVQPEIKRAGRVDRKTVSLRFQSIASGERKIGATDNGRSAPVSRTGEITGVLPLINRFLVDRQPRASSFILEIFVGTTLSTIFVVFEQILDT